MCLAYQRHWRCRQERFPLFQPPFLVMLTYRSESVQTWAKAKTSVSIQLAIHPRFPWQPEAVHAPVSKQPAGFHQCLRCGNVVWFLFIHPSILFSLSLLSPKKTQSGNSEEKNCSHNLSHLIVRCHTFHVRWTNTLWWGLYKVTLLTIHHFSIWAMLLFHLIAILSVFKTFFLLFCWSSTKTVCDNISFLEELLKEWIAYLYSPLVLSVKAEFTFWLHSS